MITITEFNNGDECVTGVKARALFRQPVPSDLITLISWGSREVMPIQIEKKEVLIR